MVEDFGPIIGGVVFGLVLGVLIARSIIANRRIKDLKKKVSTHSENLLEHSSKERTNRELIRNLQEEHVFLKKKLQLLEDDHLDWTKRLKGEKNFTPYPGG